MASYDHNIRTKYVFGHKRTNIADLKSTISVKDMCMANKDAFIAGLVENGVSDGTFYKSINDDYDMYINMIAHRLAMLDDTEKHPGLHYGDCVCIACTCNLCSCEGIYVAGLAYLSDFEESLRNKSPEVKDKIKRFDNECILFITILQIVEEYWNQYSEYSSKCFANGNTRVDYSPNIPDEKQLFEIFLNMTDEEQDKRYNRMKKVREYAENPFPIEGIPWW